MRSFSPNIVRTLCVIFLLHFASICGFSQLRDTLELCYFQQNPYAFSDNTSIKGIEVEIIQEYLTWLETKKKIVVPVKYTAYGSFEDFYFSFKRLSSNRIGMGSVTINTERTKDLDFTAGYLKDVAFLITNGNCPDIKVKNSTEVMKALGSMTAVSMGNTSLYKYVLELKTEYVKDIPIISQNDEQRILDDVARNPLHFGYVNSVTFWYYLRKYPTKFLKMQKVMSKSSEQLGFILPKGSPHKALFDEWFTGTTGFKKSPQYRAILEKYLGSYMAQNIAVN